MNSRDILTRPARRPDFTVAYGDLPDQVADVRLPPGGRAGAAPLVIVIHGGFWLAEYDRTHAGPMSEALAGLGYPVATLEYRRVGAGGGWTATFDDVAAGVTAVPGLVGVPEVVLMGHSAGGQLALWAGRTVPGVAGIVALAPVADLRLAHELGLEDDAVGRVLGGSPDQVPERYAAVDPQANLPLGVPTVVVHGEQDMQVPYRIGRGFAAASAASGDRTTLVDLPDTDHFHVIDPRSHAWPAVTAGLASVWATGRG